MTDVKVEIDDDWENAIVLAKGEIGLAAMNCIAVAAANDLDKHDDFKREIFTEIPRVRKGIGDFESLYEEYDECIEVFLRAFKAID